MQNKLLQNNFFRFVVSVNQREQNLLFILAGFQIRQCGQSRPMIDCPGVLKAQREGDRIIELR